MFHGRLISLEDDDVAMPEGPPPEEDEEDESDDDIPMPEGPPPGQQGTYYSLLRLLHPKFFVCVNIDPTPASTFPSCSSSPSPSDGPSWITTSSTH
jgi:hypothetical protein